LGGNTRFSEGVKRSYQRLASKSNGKRQSARKQEAQLDGKVGRRRSCPSWGDEKKRGRERNGGVKGCKNEIQKRTVDCKGKVREVCAGKPVGRTKSSRNKRRGKIHLKVGIQRMDKIIKKKGESNEKGRRGEL